MITERKLMIEGCSPNNEILNPADLFEITGGGIIYDIFRILNESWPDLKQGFMDARHLS